MKTGKTFVQVFIESEDSLPKEGGDYIGCVKGTDSIGWKVFCNNSKYWLKVIDWYLLPVESTLSDEELEAKYPTYYNDKLHRKDTTNDLHLWAQAGAKWARDRMIPNNDMADLVKAYEEMRVINYTLIMELSRQACNVPNTPEERMLRNKISELRQKITELRNKLNL